MRNLKKILALVLALVMSFSLMATANAFTDDEKITDTYETAVTVLDGLKVFQGYDDGSFQPQSPIRRSEVAAIIYRIVTGDVTDAQVGIYADYNKFDDVKSTSWYAGYVNFCANAEYIKGRDARTFDPDSYVTGYEALAMILRAIGYDKNGEFTGSSWQVQTAATGELRGITKNITAGTLGTYASREVVAEILFQTILVDKVNYTPAFGYQLDDTSLGWDTFELEDIEGVVIANEYADLYSGKPMKAGETELNVDGDSYVLAYASELTDIGEARHAYITEGENVLYLADAGNTVFETGAASDIAKDKDFEEVTGLERDEDVTEQFINFANDDVYEAQIRIVYDVDGDGVDVVSIGDGDELTQEQYGDIKAIFTNDDYATGWVIVGTKYDGNLANAREDDVSNDMKFSDFVDEYLKGEFNGTEVDETDNGEWLKVIDNDNDGVADYVLLTEFAMSVIERISKDNEYTLATLEREDAVRFDRNTVEIDGDDIVTEDELAEDDVVIYTLIDGNYYMSIAEMVTETVDDDRNAIDSKTETMTCDGTDYVQSHIGYGDGGIYYHDVTEAYEGDTYDLYLDHFGYVRLFVESDYDTFMLLTNGWFEDDRLNTTYQAMYWDIDAEEQAVIDVTDNGGDFIYDDSVVGTGDDETWGNLKGADVTYMGEIEDLDRDIFATNIAGYNETSDGYALKSVEDSAERMDYRVQQFVVDELVELEDETLDAVDSNRDIQTTTNTQYYLVIRDEDPDTVNGWEVEDVITWTGYKNAPDEAKLEGLSVGYAVTHASKASSTYTVADVVVFETEAYADRDVYFVYAPNNWDNWFEGRVQTVWGIGYDYDDGETITSENRLPVEEDDDVVIRNGMIEFYRIYDDETVAYIGSNYAASDIYAAVARTSWDIEPDDYIRTNVVGAEDMYISVEAPVYKVTGNAWDGYDVKKLERDKVAVGDLLILFTDGSDDDNVEYAINVTKSTYTFRDVEYAIPAVAGLWYDIAVDASNEEMPDLDVRIEAENVEVAYEITPYPEKNALGVITGWTFHVTLHAVDGYKLNAADLTIFLADDTNGVVEDMVSVGNDLVVVVTGMTKNNTLIVTGEGAVDADARAAALLEAYTDFTTPGGDNDDEREALFAAALAYEDFMGTDPDADAAYAAAEAAADKIAADIDDAALNSFTGIKAAMDLPQLSDNAEKLVTWSTGDVPAADDYDDKLEDIAEAAALYNKAYEVVKTYNAWNAATLPSEEAAARADYLAAYGAITSEDLNRINDLTDSSWYTFDTGTKWEDAYNERYDEIKDDNADLVAEAKAAIEAAIPDGDEWTAIVGADLTADDIEADLKAQVQAVLDADTANDYSGLTVSFDSYPIVAPAVGAPADTVWFQIDLKAGAATDSVGGQTVSVTNQYSKESLTKAVHDYIAGYDCSPNANEVTYENAFKGIIENEFASLTNVTVSVTLGDSVDTGDTFQVVVTATDPVAGAINVTATATITR